MYCRSFNSTTSLVRSARPTSWGGGANGQCERLAILRGLRHSPVEGFLVCNVGCPSSNKETDRTRFVWGSWP